MAEVETVIYTRLSGYAGLIALTSTRIYPLILPQSPTLPAVTYQRIDGPRESRFGADPVAHPRIQVDSWAKTYAGVKAVAPQVRGALQLWSSAATDPVVMTVEIDSDED